MQLAEQKHFASRNGRLRAHSVSRHCSRTVHRVRVGSVGERLAFGVFVRLNKLRDFFLSQYYADVLVIRQPGTANTIR